MSESEKPKPTPADTLVARAATAEGAAAAVADALKMTARASERADAILSSSAGRILTREGRYYERLLHQVVVGAYMEGAMAGAAIATQRAVSGMSGAATIARVPELERFAEEPPRGVEFVELDHETLDTLDTLEEEE